MDGIMKKLKDFETGMDKKCFKHPQFQIPNMDTEV